MTEPPGPDGGHAQGSTILGIGVTPMPLNPVFQRDIQDYYVRCNAGHNLATVKVLDNNGWEDLDVDMVEGQLVNIRDQYYIRCLPHDFPQITVTKHPDVGDPSPGWYLVNSASYAAVIDGNGVPVWYAKGDTVLNVDAQRPNVVSFMRHGQTPFVSTAGSSFQVWTLDGSVAPIDVQAVGSPADFHDFRMLANGNYLLLSYPIEPHVDLTGLKSYGNDETLADCAIQEVDPQGNLVWSWLATDHVDPVQESLEPSTWMVGNGNAVDVFHCNSIDVDATGNILLSMRQANTVLYIDRQTGAVQWKLGGTTYNKDGAPYIAVVGDDEGTFSMQHDARLHDDGSVSMFDNHGAATDGVARCIDYAIDHTKNEATPVWQVRGLGQSKYEGSCRLQDDGDIVVGWGFVPGDERVITEVDANGDEVFAVEFAGQPEYRAIKVPISQLDLGLLRSTAGMN